MPKMSYGVRHMAKIRKIAALTFTWDREPELLAKLNSLAPHMYRNVHDLARYFMTSAADEKIRELDISVDYSRPTQSARAG